MNRRHFIAQSVSASSLLLLQPTFAFSAASKAKKLVILHTNDVHSHIDPFPKEDAKYSGQGGIARRAAVIEQVRRENEQVLLLDSGDIFQGTPYFNFFGGELEFKLMSMLGYDVATVGNHDFDNGVSGFLKHQEHVKFAFVNANYDLKSAGLKEVLKPYKIVNKGGLKIGIFGLGIDLNGLVEARNCEGVVYRDPVGIANEIAAELKQKHCDLVICLSHLGYSYRDNKISDVKLAAQSENIDLILGGHTHTFLEKPTVIDNKIGKKVLVNQVGCYGLQLGRLDYTFVEGSYDTSKTVIQL
ncbi:bifunctional metallophosphatase/5'-nucleotidase [Flavobacterium sp.]|uniref:bifunctional metallophosphatase/5'-nucleotidase n=1 Tax=Flavobacterium sp. TaxID=239 RepID=UPI003B9C1724